MPTIPFVSAIQPAIESLKRLATIRPKQAKLTIGLDVGSSSVKVVALGPRRATGQRLVIGQHLVPLTEGQDADASEAIKAAVNKLQLPSKMVNLAVSGQWVVIRVVEMPTMKPAEMKQALPFEAQRYLPFNVQEVVIDGAFIGPSEGNKSWVLIVACKKELLERRIDWTKRAGLEAAVIDVDALALANAFLATTNGHDAKKTRALMNVGAQLTNLVVFLGDTPYLIRDIPWGGEKLARSVAEQLAVDELKVKEQLSQPGASPELLNALKLSSEALVTELQLSFDYFENRFGQPPEEILVSGGLAQSSGFLEAFKSHLTQPVTSWTPASGLSSQFAVAYGLALRTS